jgi:hypothetical protein
VEEDTIFVDSSKDIWINHMNYLSNYVNGFINILEGSMIVNISKQNIKTNHDKVMNYQACTHKP